LTELIIHGGDQLTPINEQRVIHPLM